MKINLNDEKLIDELVLVLKLFYTQEQIDNLDYVFDITQQVNDMEITTQLDFLDKKYSSKDIIKDKKFPERYKKRYAKLLLYNALKELNPEKKLPWGSLTGIRPTKLYYELIIICILHPFVGDNLFLEIKPLL